MEAAIDILADPYAAGVLKPDKHEGIVTDLQTYCETAGIRPKHVIKSMKGVCAQTEMDWVRDLRSHPANDIAGLAYVGASNVQERMSALCGALVRNFIDARVVSVQALVAKGDTPDPTVLICPNFFLGNSGGKGIAAWEATQLFGLLMERLNRERMSVLNVTNMKALGEAYGSAFVELIEQNYNTTG